MSLDLQTSDDDVVPEPAEVRGRSSSWKRALGAPSSRVRSRWRADIQGLRGVAILGVVLYHADPRLVPGGFAGVDVFFVISGFLITGLLVGELERDGRISFRRFYARRIRRLLPMALLVLVVTVAVADRVQPSFDAARTAKDALASALYVANYRFAFEQTNYLNASLAPSPFQHYWSLGVEEQMYALWPLLLVVSTMAWRRRRPVRLAGGVVFLILGVAASFYFCVRLTHENQPWAFFSFPTRAWELGLGGLVAFAAPALRTIPRTVATVVGLVGLAAIGWSMYHFGATTPWPGVAAAVPVGGAVAVIAAGCARRREIAGWALSFPPLQFIGRISYSWYLWHWPALILAPFVVHHALDVKEALVITAGSGVVAAASSLLIEEPLHVSRWLALRARRGLALGLGLTGAGVAVCIASVTALALPSTAATTSPRATVPHRVTHVDVSAVADDSFLASSTGQLQSELLAADGLADVPDDLSPSIAGAFSDVPVLYNNGCVDTFTSTILNSCLYGDTTASTSVVLFGDSHAAMWFPAIDLAAEANSWKLYAWTKDTCPPFDLDVFSPDLDRTYTECATWRQEVLTEIATIHPALVILGVARHYSPIYGFTVYSDEWLNALSQMVSAITALDTRVLVIGPIPKPSASVPNCLSQNLDDVSACDTLRGRGVDLPGMHAEEQTVTAAGGDYINTLFWFCSAEKICPPIVGDTLVYRDDNHITGTYSALLADPFSAALDLAIRGAPAPGSAVLLTPASP